MPERPNGADCKSAAFRATQVRILPPPLRVTIALRWDYEPAHIAQLAEHVLGKNGVTSSNLVVGLKVLKYRLNKKGEPWQKRSLIEPNHTVMWAP